MQAGLTTRRLTLREVFVFTPTSLSILTGYDATAFADTPDTRRPAPYASIELSLAA